MALIIRGTACALCERVIGDSDEVVATSHFIADRSDPLWPFSDAAMHATCFAEWPLREEFIVRFNAVAGQHVFGNGMRHRMEPDGSIVSEKARGA